MPGAVPITSTYALTNATMPYVIKLATEGAAALAADPGFLAGLNVAAGKVTYAPVAEVVGVEAVRPPRRSPDSPRPYTPRLSRAALRRHSRPREPGGTAKRPLPVCWMYSVSASIAPSRAAVVVRAVRWNPRVDDRAQRLADFERRFRRAGLPLLSEDFSARSDVFNRAFPLLALVLLVELLAALDVDWSPLANAAAVAGALAVDPAAVALVNRARGRRALAIPEEVGAVELTLFALVPAAVLGAVHGGWGLVVLAGNLALLALVALTFGFGLGAIVVWSARRLGGQLAHSLLLLARAIPLLLFFSLVLFLTTEMWQVSASAAARRSPRSACCSRS